MKQTLLLLTLLVTLASCSRQETMEALTNRVFKVAEQQYVAMDSRLTDQTMPQTIAPDGTFLPYRHPLPLQETGTSCGYALSLQTEQYDYI